MPSIPGECSEPVLLSSHKKAQTGLPGGDLGKAEAACLVAPFSHSASKVFSPRPVPACLLVTPAEACATVHRLPLMPFLTASATTCLPFPFLVSAGACPLMGAGEGRLSSSP